MTGTCTLTLAIMAVLAADPAAAQPPGAARSPLVRADLQATLGWFNAHAESADRYNDWYNRSLYGGAAAGWYWTDHVKTEIEFGGSTAADLYASEPIVVAGQPAHLTFRQKFSTKKIAAAQQYQFYRNAWFHPHLTAGIDLSWEMIERRDDPVYAYDPAIRQGRIVRPPQNHPRTTSLEVRPFAALGFKAYMNQRSFFRSDLRLAVRGGVDEVLLRFGFGVDF